MRPLVVDANVWVSALDRTELRSDASRAFLGAVGASRHPIALPEFAEIEVACALSRRLRDTGQGRLIARQALDFPLITWHALTRRMVRRPWPSARDGFFVPAMPSTPRSRRQWAVRSSPGTRNWSTAQAQSRRRPGSRATRIDRDHVTVSVRPSAPRRLDFLAHARSVHPGGPMPRHQPSRGVLPILVTCVLAAILVPTPTRAQMEPTTPRGARRGRGPLRSPGHPRSDGHRRHRLAAPGADGRRHRERPHRRGGLGGLPAGGDQRAAPPGGGRPRD